MKLNSAAVADLNRHSRSQLSLTQQAIEVLAQHPLMGRVARGERALISSVGTSSAVAPYQDDEVEQLVRGPGVRDQREAGDPRR